MHVILSLIKNSRRSRMDKLKDAPQARFMVHPCGLTLERRLAPLL